MSGQGYSIVGSKKIQWKAGDTFCIPSWFRYQNVADEATDVYLYRFHDKPMLSSLGFYRVEGTDLEALVSDYKSAFAALNTICKALCFVLRVWPISCCSIR